MKIKLNDKVNLELNFEEESLNAEEFLIHNELINKILRISTQHQSLINDAVEEIKEPQINYKKDDKRRKKKDYITFFKKDYSRDDFLELYDKYKNMSSKERELLAKSFGVSLLRFRDNLGQCYYKRIKSSLKNNQQKQNSSMKFLHKRMSVDEFETLYNNYKGSSLENKRLIASQFDAGNKDIGYFTNKLNERYIKLFGKRNTKFKNQEHKQYNSSKVINFYHQSFTIEEFKSFCDKYFGSSREERVGICQNFRRSKGTFESNLYNRIKIYLGNYKIKRNQDIRGRPLTAKWRNPQLLEKVRDITKKHLLNNRFNVSAHTVFSEAGWEEELQGGLHEGMYDYIRELKRDILKEIAKEEEEKIQDSVELQNQKTEIPTELEEDLKNELKDFEDKEEKKDEVEDGR